MSLNSPSSIAQPFKCDGYCLVVGEGRDRHWLEKFLTFTYSSLFPEQQEFHHLRQTVEQYFCGRTPLWWVYPQAIAEAKLFPTQASEPIAGLWLGNAIDQVTGERHGQIFMLYVTPPHRQKGIATALLQQAKYWCQQRGDRRLGLQVFSHNQPARNLYAKLGFAPKALILHHDWS